MQKIYLYILYFFFYSAVGWAFESTYCSIGERKIINRGFLTGPMCPIYGTGTLVMEIFLYNPFRNNPAVVLFLGMLLCDIVEYMTSFIMEKLFNARWWDYKNELFNINGRICFKHTIIWGMSSLAFVKLVHPKTEIFFSRFSDSTVKTAVLIILCVFLIDVVFAVIKASDMKKLLDKLNELKEIVSANVSDVKTTVDEKYSSFRLIAEGKYDRLILNISGKCDDIGVKLDKSNDKINDKRDEIILQAILKIESFEEKIKRKNSISRLKISKNYVKYLRSKNLHLNVRALSGEIKGIIEDIKTGTDRTEESNERE